eukprot:TRINITY_DN684_c0_g1_i1.p1 TRINITY_DN684_c0_g1~~TRINITY_DN684_c0_g1_i1.p1  ORF type:complete len:256 (-),score=50.82 TRINITY_DN684_c0_g1_i1:778-1545(-)
MYLHELGEDDDSFTKEDMSQGKHLLTSARRVSKYHPNFMNGREFLNSSAADVLSNKTEPTKVSLTRSLELPRRKLSTDREMDESYYRDWQETFIDDDREFTQQARKKMKGEFQETSDNLPESFQAWLKLLLHDSSATPSLKVVNKFQKIWSAETGSTKQSRFAFARQENQESVLDSLSMKSGFPLADPSTGSWSPSKHSDNIIRHPAANGKIQQSSSNWSFQSYIPNYYTQHTSNNWNNSKVLDTESFSDAPPGL